MNVINLNVEYERLSNDYNKIKHLNSQLKYENKQLKHILIAKDNEIHNLKVQLDTLKENILKVVKDSE